MLGLLGLGGLGVLTGARIQDAISRVLGPVELRDPTGLLALLPLGSAFRFYSVTGSVPSRSTADYRLDVGGLVHRRSSYTFAELQAMQQTSLRQDFVCVTGWRVLGVPWVGVRLSDLLDRVGVSPRATALRFFSFDGTYTESLTIDEARRPDVLVALRLQDGPVTHDHGGPVRMYVGGNYGYKSTKWLSRIEVTDDVVPGYWETRGYAVNGEIRN